MDLSKTGIFLLLFSNLAFELSSAGFIDVATINRPTLMRYAKPMHCNKKKTLARPNNNTKNYTIQFTESAT